MDRKLTLQTWLIISPPTFKGSFSAKFIPIKKFKPKLHRHRQAAIHSKIFFSLFKWFASDLNMLWNKRNKFCLKFPRNRGFDWLGMRISTRKCRAPRQIAGEKEEFCTGATHKYQLCYEQRVTILVETKSIFCIFTASKKMISFYL